MEHGSNVICGTVDTSIHELLRLNDSRKGSLLPSYSSVLVRSIDSMSRTDLLIRAIERKQIPLVAKSGIVMLTRDALLLANERGLFTGFDELWFFDDGGIPAAIGEHVGLTSDGVLLSMALPPGLLAAFHDSRCLLALGDGCGLNYVTTQTALAEFLETSYDTIVDVDSKLTSGDSMD